MTDRTSVQLRILELTNIEYWDTSSIFILHSAGLHLETKLPETLIQVFQIHYSHIVYVCNVVGWQCLQFMLAVDPYTDLCYS